MTTIGRQRQQLAVKTKKQQTRTTNSRQGDKQQTRQQLGDKTAISRQDNKQQTRKQLADKNNNQQTRQQLADKDNNQQTRTTISRQGQQLNVAILTMA